VVIIKLFIAAVDIVEIPLYTLIYKGLATNITQGTFTLLISQCKLRGLVDVGKAKSFSNSTSMY